MADNLMEGLISARISPVCAYCRQQYSCFIPKFIQVGTKRVSVSPIGMMKQPKSFNSVVASLQPLETSTMGCFDNTVPSKEVLEVWQNAKTVCFDVDNTICLDEGIDELAEFCGAGKAVAEWTARAMNSSVPFEEALAARAMNGSLLAFSKAMNGSMPFEEALAARLSLFNPSLAQVQVFLEKRPPRISPGSDELIKQLRDNVIPLKPIASILGIPLENIFANKLLFESSGEFLGLDTNEATSRNGGKATIVQQIRKAHGYQSLIMIGDGATDLEARQPGGADLFICYGGSATSGECCC